MFKCKSEKEMRALKVITYQRPHKTIFGQNPYARQDHLLAETHMHVTSENSKLLLE